MDIKYPQVVVRNFGMDGNPLALIAECREAAKTAGLNPSLIKEFLNEAFSDDYDHVLQTCMIWFDIRHFSESSYEMKAE